MKKLLRKAFMAPDGTVLESVHRHDYKSYKDKNGKTYIIDGGLDPISQTCMNKDKICLNVYVNDPFELVRCVIKRYNSIDNKVYRLKDIPNEWLENILSYYNPSDFVELMDTDYYLYYLMEKQYRNEKEIYID